MSAQLKIVTYNIHKGFSLGKLKFMLPKMRDALEQVNADLVFLQEVQGEHTKREKRIQNWPDATQFDFIAEQLWPHVTYGKNAIYQSGHHGNAILSKYPLLHSENINVSNQLRASRSVLHSVIDIPGFNKIVHVICIHFGLFKNERNDQMDILTERIADYVSHDEPVIIAGDFNEWRQSAFHVFEEKLQLQEVFKLLEGKYAKSFPAWRPTLRMDRIYFRGLKLIGGERLTNKPWRLLSDHLPLTASFSLHIE